MTTEIVRVEITSEIPPRTSDFRKFMRVFLARKSIIVCLAIMMILVISAIFAPLLAPYNPYAQNLNETLLDSSAQHLLGTDYLGRDVLSRIIYGSRASLAVGVVAVAIAGGIGMALGLVSGYFGGFLDSIIMRVMDALMAIPPIILALSLGAALGGGLANVMIALGIALVPAYARLMRGQVLTVRHADYVIASELSGASTIRNMLVHVVPNCMSPLIVLITMNLGSAILSEAGLSYLGLGIAPPGAAWGSMVNDGYKYLEGHPMLSFAPGIAIMAVVMSFNIVGDALRDALDPKLRGSQ
jgi:peptide/nickel transport system permease protein